MRRLAAALILAAALAGCNAAGQSTSDVTYRNPNVPFTMRVPADFTKASIDHGDTSGNVVAAVGLTKVDVIAVRRTGARSLPAGPLSHRVQGHAVTSELHAVDGGGWAIECQYTSEGAKTVRDACRRAIASVRRR
jgi:hypothetical protein